MVVVPVTALPETAPAPAGELALSEEEGEPEEQLGFEDYLRP